MNRVDTEDRIESANRDNKRQDLQAPVHSILGYIGYLQEEIEADDSATQSWQAVGTMHDAALQLSELAGQFSKRAADDDGTDRRMLRHDMRNCVGVIDGYSQMLLEDLADELSENSGSPLQRYLENISHEARHVMAALEDGGESAPTREESAAVAKVFASFKEGIPRDEGDAASGIILVVDDNASSRELLVHQLQRQGHATLEADSGSKALAVMCAELPDLVLLDLIMPDVSGYEVLTAMRASAELRRIPAIMVSGLSDEQGAVRCIDAGASDYLVKPVVNTLLRARVSALLERKRWHDKEQQYQLELEKSRDFIRKIFGRYLSDEIVERLLDDNDGLDLGGTRQEVSILFADIRGFTSISQELSPENTVTLLNKFLGTMADVIIRYGGTVDEFIGDGILAIFGAPVKSADDAARAVACAVAMQHSMEEVNAYAAANGLPEVCMGIGINSGEVVVGNIGSEQRSKYGVVGHHVNLASRIESGTRGGQVLISEHTYLTAGVKIETAEMITSHMRNVEGAVTLYDVFGIGAPFNLYLGEKSLELVAIAPPIEVEVLAKSNPESGSAGARGQLLAVQPGELEVSVLGAELMLGDVVKLCWPSVRHGGPVSISGRIVSKPARDDRIVLFHNPLEPDMQCEISAICDRQIDKSAQIDGLVPDRAPCEPNTPIANASGRS